MVSMKKFIFNILPIAIKNKIRIVFVGSFPGNDTTKGISLSDWRKRQEKKEITFWLKKYRKKAGKRNFKRYYKDTYQNINADMFKDLRLDCKGLKVVDLGCGPFGSLPLRNYTHMIGIEPLAQVFQLRFRYPHDWLVIESMAEIIPLKTRTIDNVYCINALDHFQSPYESLEETIRILKPKGYLALSTDVGGTPGHPCKILEKDLDETLVGSGRFDIIERRCTKDIKSSWPSELNIPSYVFQGLKKS